MKKDDRLSRLPAAAWEAITINFTLTQIGKLREVCKDFYFPLTEVWDSRLWKSWNLVSIYTNCNSYWTSSHIIFRTQDGRLFAHAQHPSILGLPGDDKASLVQVALPPARDVYCQTDSTWVDCFNGHSYRILGKVVSDECDHYITYDDASFIRYPMIHENSIHTVQRRIGLAYLYSNGHLYITQSHWHFAKYRVGANNQLVHERVKNIIKFKEGLLVLSLEGEIYFIDEKYLKDLNSKTPTLVKIEGIRKVSQCITDLDTLFFQRDDELSIVESVSPAQESLLCTMPHLRQVMRIKHLFYLLNRNGDLFRRTLDQNNKLVRIASNVKQLIRDGHDRDTLYLLYFSGKLVCRNEDDQEHSLSTNVCQVISEPKTEAGYEIRTNVIEHNDGTLSFLGGPELRWINSIGRERFANFCDLQKPAIRFFNQRRSQVLELFKKRELIPEPQTSALEPSDKRQALHIYSECSMNILTSLHLTEELRGDFVRVFNLMKPAMIAFQKKHPVEGRQSISWLSIGEKMVKHYLSHEPLDLNTVKEEIIFLLNNNQVETGSAGQSIAAIIQRMFYLESKLESQENKSQISI